MCSAVSLIYENKWTRPDTKFFSSLQLGLGSPTSWMAMARQMSDTANDCPLKRASHISTSISISIIAMIAIAGYAPLTLGALSTGFGICP